MSGVEQLIPMVHSQSQPLPLAAGEEEVDPELLALPDPPRKERTLALAALAITAVAACVLALSLRHDVGFAFSHGDARQLGSLATAPLASLPDNELVEAEVELGAAHALRFERPFVEDSFRVVPVLGRDDLWVELRIERGQVLSRAVPPSKVRGRLVSFDDAGPRHRRLAGSLEEARGAALPAGARLLVQGEHPADLRFSAVIAAAALAFAAWCALSIAQAVRRVRH